MIRAYSVAQETPGVTEAQLAEHLSRIDARLLEAESHGGGQVAVKLREARADANEINEGLRREYEEFTKYLAQRAAQPRITVLGLWVQMREEILAQRSNELFFLPDTNILEILVNRDQTRLRELQNEQMLKQSQPQPGPPPR